ncbi:amino acid racemase [Salmonella enterica subsp. enterica serovar Typhi]|nr:amino acid racemase [Salmonella enterica subsp. enterica serovar Typhi]CGB61810.1 amino acid racemase [Salmonella enterica subsp. enterica serovar Typhi]CHF76993.1 amino acid racemase [Salmonella enterica subsp. enterica serovar Typhi]CHR82548.1 amino acid racemase [Salmonella enterica subsp. enterica serovar Typhi]CRJ32867.1 amino acid racemase [Salmonella enterica subsp. enterica serovar Typhi]
MYMPVLEINLRKLEENARTEKLCWQAAVLT